jgi:DnaK suppressor protein
VDNKDIEIPSYVSVENEEYMNANQRAHIEKILIMRRQSLMECVDLTVTHMKEASTFSHPPDESDQASEAERFAIELRTRDRERKLIKKIEDSLERLHSDDFGYCEACGIEIGLKRLEARPTATLCIDCKTLSEIKEKQGN